MSVDGNASYLQLNQTNNNITRASNMVNVSDYEHRRRPNICQRCKACVVRNMNVSRRDLL